MNVPEGLANPVYSSTSEDVDKETEVKEEQSARKRSASCVGGHRILEMPADEDNKQVVELDKPEYGELQILQHEQERINEEQEKLKALQPFSGFYLDVLIKPWSENESTGTKRYFYKPLRGLVRTVYALAVCLLAPGGAIHHFYKFIKGINDSDSEIKKRAWEHLTASSMDARAFFEGVVMTALAVVAVAAACMAYLQSMWLMVLAGASLSAGLLAFGTPLPAYMIAPQTMEGKYLLKDYLCLKHEKENNEIKIRQAKIKLKSEKEMYQHEISMSSLFIKLTKEQKTIFQALNAEAINRREFEKLYLENEKFKCDKEKMESQITGVRDRVNDFSSKFIEIAKNIKTNWPKAFPILKPALIALLDMSEIENSKSNRYEIKELLKG